MSLMNNEIQDIPDDPEFPDQTCLITLFLQNNRLVEISYKFFVVMSTLVVLDLSSNPDIIKLPDEISELVSLRFLKLLGTRIMYLPEGFSKLLKLIHLDLEFTNNLRSICQISGLLKLQVLRFYGSAAALDISLLKNLEGLRALQLLTITVREVDVLKAFLESNVLPSCTQGLYLDGLEVSGVSGKSFAATFGDLGSLSKLQMTDCYIKESETEWEENISRHCSSASASSSSQITPSNMWFKNLSAVVLYSCLGLTDLTWLIYAGNLESLSVQTSPMMVEVISKEKARDVCVKPFLKLQVLDLGYLDELESIYWSSLSFPSLQRVNITECWKLRKLPLNSTSVERIDDLRIEVDDGWLDGVEWESEAEERFRHAFHTACVSSLNPTLSIMSNIPEVKSFSSQLVADAAQLYSPAPKQQIWEYSQNLEKNLEDLEMEVETLNAMINELLRRMLKEKDKGLQTLPEVEKWISMAEETESKASSLLDESISECHDLSTYDDGSKISESTLHYSEMVCMTLKDVKALRSEGVFKELAERPPLSHVKMMLPLQPIVSREMLLEKVWKCLTENKCRTLGLYGMAGVGKTTLLTQIKKKFIEVRYVSIGLVLFVVVESEEVEGIQVAIMKRLGLDWRQRSEREKASEIYEFLNRMRFVLLLDGVQREGLDLACIGVPEPTRGNGCKIVFTTRFQEACRSKWVDVVEEVKCLSPEEACCFFQEIVGETTLKSHPDIPQLARIVARKCGGLPIALSLIGETMSRKRNVREWHHAIHVLVSSAALLRDMKYEIFPILKISYDSLPGENIRSCFLYCALFPKDEDTSKQDLVDCWIGEGIIEEEDREMAEIQGYEMMDDLVRMRLLMDNESGYGVKMHGMVREMALWIASDFERQKEKFVVVGGAGIQQMPEDYDWGMVTRLSVTCTRIENISDFPDCSELKTLLLQGNNNLKWISGDFFRCRTSLVVLNLSRNRELSELPEEVSSLVSLQLLNLSWTRIKRLPLGLKELKRLIHLDLDDTPLLREIDVIGYLLNLQVLRLFRSVPMDHSLMDDIKLLKSLKELSLTLREADVLKRLLSIHQLASCIRRLHLSWITDVGILLLNSMLSLRELDIGMCDIPEITIDNIEKIPLLQNIHTVTLSWCKGIKDLTWLLLAPNLGDLRIHECQQIERIINKEKTPVDMSEQPFQNLTRLSLDSLPQLESIYWTPLPFPVLEYLYIAGCPKLSTDFDQEWIEVEWEDEATKQHFSDIDDRDFPTMAEDPHPVENIVLLETLESGKSTTTNSITGEKVFQSGTDTTMEHTQTYRVLTPDAMSGIKKNTPGSSGSGVSSKTNRSTVPSSLSINSDRTLESLPTPRTEGEILSSLNLKAFTFNELKSATKNFRRESLLGEGGFGYVCKGWIDEVTCTASRPGRGICVAVKKLKTEGFQGHKEWLTEVNYLGRFSHPNLVKLVGYCIEGEDRLLVYEFMPKGSLENHLFSRSLQPLTWAVRMKIAIGTAKGLTFLHEAESQVMCIDFKAAKILLDADFNAKLSDFGLAKAGPTGDRTHVSTHVMGTHGYVAPEYLAAGHLTTKSNVYSFGVVLLELLSGRRAVNISKERTEQSLVDWATPYLRHKRKLFRIMDPRLNGQYPQKEAYRAASLALLCLNPNPNFRPKMLEVRAKLEQLKSTT